jgi:hypothetical protein
MRTLFKEVGFSLSLLIESIEIGEIGLPEIQRPFVWPNSKVRDLFDSMYRGFPVGYLLFWVNGFSEVHRQIGTDVKQKVPRLLIVDGQQRLTSLYAVMKGISVLRKDYSQERIHIAFRPRDQKFDVADAAIRRDPEFISDISQLWSGPLLRHQFVQRFLRRLGDHRPLDEDEKGELYESIDRLYDLKDYPFRVLELSATVDEENVAEVFVRINSKGTTLNQADFILTLMSVFWDDGRTELEHFCRDARQPSISASSPYNYFIQPDPDQLLRVNICLGFRRARLRHVYSILRGKDLETEEFSDERREQQFAVLEDAQGYALNLQNWHEFLKVLMRAGFRSGKMISSQNALLYAYALFLIGKRDYGIDSYTLRNTMARWFFMASLTGRYTGSPETRMEQDLALLRGIESGQEFARLVERIIADTFTEDYWNINLPNALATSSARSPSLFAYYAALNLLGARVLFSKMTVSELLDPALRGPKAAIERHHLFPRGYLKTLGLTSTRDTNQIANFALVEWSDNIDISDKSPAEYFPQYAARFTQQELDEMMYWHALPKGWEKMEYPEVLEARRKGIARVIRDGFLKLSETLDE